MSKKKIIFIVLAALFAVSGLTALPGGNYTGGIGCIVIAAVFGFLAFKTGSKTPQAAGQAQTAAAPVKASGSRLAETIRTKLAGVTFDNEDGENRQDILSQMDGSEDITVEKYTYNGEPAAYVKCGGKVLGNLSAELAKDLFRKYPNATYEAQILDITGGGGNTYGCNIELDIYENTPQEKPPAQAGETLVYIDRKSKKYHSKADCSGMKRPQAIPINKARKKYTPCKKCCK